MVIFIISCWQCMPSLDGKEPLNKFLYLLIKSRILGRWNRNLKYGILTAGHYAPYAFVYAENALFIDLDQKFDILRLMEVGLFTAQRLGCATFQCLTSRRFSVQISETLCADAACKNPASFKHLRQVARLLIHCLPCLYFYAPISYLLRSEVNLSGGMKISTQSSVNVCSAFIW